MADDEYTRGEVTKWKIGWSDCTKMGSESDCAFAQCRTPSLVRMPERKRTHAICTPM